MKKLSIALTVMLVAVMAMFCLTACGTAGTYKFDSMTLTLLGKDTVYKAGEEVDIMGEKVKLSKDSYKLELKSDGKAVFVTKNGDEEHKEECEWKEEDGKVILFNTVDDKEVEFMTFTVDGGKLVFEIDLSVAKMKITLKK